jgi:dipeptidyl aminopeptidase/acylaminoacyl peptidase
VTFLNTIPEYWMTWKLRWKVPVGDYTTEAGLRFLEERSPLNRADQIVRPLLIGQGANDARSILRVRDRWRRAGAFRAGAY